MLFFFKTKSDTKYIVSCNLKVTTELECIVDSNSAHHWTQLWFNFQRWMEAKFCRAQFDNSLIYPVINRVGQSHELFRYKSCCCSSSKQWTTLVPVLPIDGVPLEEFPSAIEQTGSLNIAWYADLSVWLYAWDSSCPYQGAKQAHLAQMSCLHRQGSLKLPWSRPKCGDSMTYLQAILF